MAVDRWRNQFHVLNYCAKQTGRDEEMNETGSKNAREDKIHNLGTLGIRKIQVFNTYINYSV